MSTPALLPTITKVSKGTRRTPSNPPSRGAERKRPARKNKKGIHARLDRENEQFPCVFLLCASWIDWMGRGVHLQEEGGDGGETGKGHAGGDGLAAGTGEDGRRGRGGGDWRTGGGSSAGGNTGDVDHALDRGLGGGADRDALDWDSGDADDRDGGGGGVDSRDGAGGRGKGGHHGLGDGAGAVGNGQGGGLLRNLSQPLFSACFLFFFNSPT